MLFKLYESVLSSYLLYSLENIFILLFLFLVKGLLLKGLNVILGSDDKTWEYFAL